MIQRLFRITFLLLLLSAWPTLAATYTVPVTRTAENVYTILDSNIILLTRSCTVSAYGGYATLYMSAATGAQDGLISFGSGYSCTVSGAYSPTQISSGRTTASLAYIANGLFFDTAQKQIVQASACPSAYNGPVTLALTSNTLSYRDGFSIGSIEFSNGVCFRSCTLSGIFRLTDMATIAIPVSGPTLSDVYASDITANGGKLWATSSRIATGYWIIQPYYVRAPSSAQVIAGTDGFDNPALARGNTQLAAGTPANITFSGLTPASAYVAYFAARDNNGLASVSGQASFTTSISVSTPTSPPVATPVPGVTPTPVATPAPNVTPVPTAAPATSIAITSTAWNAIRARNAVLTATVDHDAESYWMVLPYGANPPTANQVIAGVDASGKSVALKGYGPMKANAPTSFVIPDLQQSTYHTLVLAARAASGVSTIKTINFNTAAGNPPQAPIKPETGWWWNPSEGGRGYSLELNASGRIFFAGYMYDADGNPVWYVSTLTQNADTGYYSGDLLQYSGGQHLTGTWHAPASTSSAGTVTLMPTSARTATLKFEGKGFLPQVTNVERFPITSTGLAEPAIAANPQTGWWWNPREGGRGYFIEVQGNTAFIAAFMYDTDGKPTWYATQDRVVTPSLYQGSLALYGRGQVLGGSYASPIVTNANAGTVVLKFFSTGSGQMILPGGITIPIQRFDF